ncbi:hypothetical protein EVAR_7493_1 [Eumeta japonica]|uniref:Uncharacterized protein n=1 Tax=Eumeta variegata TaxID=151549 RepID=A0A4C1Y2T8_EUMVA|nr:hypothetical protein EVAR_7493_1 [Eumeta japonica]
MTQLENLYYFVAFVRSSGRNLRGRLRRLLIVFDGISETGCLRELLSIHMHPCDFKKAVVVTGGETTTDNAESFFIMTVLAVTCRPKQLGFWKVRRSNWRVIRTIAPIWRSTISVHSQGKE